MRNDLKVDSVKWCRGVVLFFSRVWFWGKKNVGRYQHH
jgi:hypothetical protein